MRMRLTRRSDALLPLLLLVPALLGRAENVAALLTAWLLARLATLSAADAFRRAAAGEVSDRRNRGNAATALLVTLGLSAAAWRWGGEIWTWLFSQPVDGASWDALCLTGALMALARLNGEMLRARAQVGSAELCDLLSAVLIAAAVASGGPHWWMGAAALSMLVSLVILLSVGGWPYARPRAAVLPRLPGAAARALIYPVPGLLLLAGFVRGGARFAEVGYLLGLAAFASAAAPFRRTDMESPGLNLWLLAPAAAAVAAAAWLPDMRPAATLYGIAALLAMSVNAALTPRALGAMLLTAAAAALCHIAPGWAATACAAGAWALLLPDVRRARLRNRQQRLREKNIRSILG